MSIIISLSTSTAENQGKKTWQWWYEGHTWEQKGESKENKGILCLGVF